MPEAELVFTLLVLERMLKIKMRISGVVFNSVQGIVDKNRIMGYYLEAIVNEAHEVNNGISVKIKDCIRSRVKA